MITWVGLIAGALTTGAWIPQLVRTWKTKHADDISYAYLATFCTGILTWLVYGIAKGEIAIIVANALTLTLSLWQVWLKVHSKPHVDTAVSDLAPTLRS